MSLRSFALLLLATATLAAAQTTTTQPDCGLTHLQVCALHVAQDEAGIVTAPFHVNSNALYWVVPFGVATGVALDQDQNALEAVGVHPTREKDFGRFSDYGGIYGPSAAVGVGYIAGSMTHNDHLRETAVLAGEAMADSIILNTGLGYAIDRQTPLEGDGTGRFWPHGLRTWPDGQSMPSDHSVLVWSFAHVVASEYNGWATRLIVYSLATGVSGSRVMARDHFPSDVLVGAGLGYFIGGYVMHRRSERSDWGHFSLSAVSTPNGRGIGLNIRP
ncbi:phosphatase PAP2 family protein [Silvibacterium dinghuense]|nr:phosphatase PAP2 family protein [Silvibacterium dinghuense]